MITSKPLRCFVMAALVAALSSCSVIPSPATSAPNQSVAAGTVWTVPASTALASLTVGPGARLRAPAGKSLTLTVNGVETGIVPGKYSGNVILTVTDELAVPFAGMGGAGAKLHLFRQALYLDESGVVASKSVLAAAGDYRLQGNVLSGVSIKSSGEDFNGIVVTGGSYVVKGAQIQLDGNGGNDFVGFGAAILTRGKGTRLVLDGAKIHNRGAIRTAAVADQGSQLIVRNSELETRDGTLPADYRSNVTPGEMKDVPWMLGLAGNVRATNLLGDGTTATYINTSIASERWGVLSVDASQDARLTAIDSKVTNLGNSGYGSYAIGSSVNAFYGTQFDVADYAVIVTGGKALFAASTPQAVAQVNSELQLGLSGAELRALPRRATTVNSRRFGVMWHGDGDVAITDDTVFNTAETSFLVKGVRAGISVDGARGARINPGNGVLVQVMDDDDPGPVMENGMQLNDGVYHEPAMAPVKVAGFDVTAASPADVVVNLSNITLQGNLFNSTAGGRPSGMGAGAPPSSAAGPGVMSGPAGAGAAPAAVGPAGGGPAGGRNLIVNLDNATLAGVISSSTARHRKSIITAADFKLLGELSNTASATVNNGVQVSLNRSTWTVTGRCYLSKLSVGTGSALAAPKGFKLGMTVNGVATNVGPGSYSGAIVIDTRRE